MGRLRVRKPQKPALRPPAMLVTGEVCGPCCVSPGRTTLSSRWQWCGRPVGPGCTAPSLSAAPKSVVMGPGGNPLQGQKSALAQITPPTPQPTPGRISPPLPPAAGSCDALMPEGSSSRPLVRRRVVWDLGRPRQRPGTPRRPHPLLTYCHRN